MYETPQIHEVYVYVYISIYIHMGRRLGARGIRIYSFSSAPPAIS